MHHVGVFEAADDIHDCISFANVRQKLVAQAFTFRSTRDQPGDIDKLDSRSEDALRFDDGGELRKSRVGYLDNTDVRLNGAEGIVFGRDAGFG